MDQEIRVVVCKVCGGHIDCGICGYECPNDNRREQERDPKTMEVRIYAFSRVEPYAPTR